MPEDPSPKKDRIPIKSFLADFGTGLSDQELMDKYELSARSFIKLIQALLEKEVISEAELDRRRQQAVERDLKRESEFIAGLYICPSCGHPHPTPFEECPACGASAEPTDTFDELSTTEISREVAAFERQNVNPPQPDPQPTLEDSEKEPVSEEPEAPEKDHGSRLGALKSFLSEKLRKKK